MIRTRLAPSPTGDPHIGTIFQALINYVVAKQKKGQFIVRIEDTDQKRYVKNSAKKLIQALEYFDLSPDEQPCRQSDRLKIYQKHAKYLIKKNQAYYCFCTPDRLDKLRKTQQKTGQLPKYDQHCRTIDPQKSIQLAKTTPHVIRLKVPVKKTIIVNDLLRGKISFDSNLLDDQVLLKSDGFPTYHLAVVVDDHLMNITHMIRGEEWLSSAPKHVLLYQAFNWQPPIMIHTPILRNPDKSKLSKRQGHASVSWYQKKGYLKEAIINFLATRVWNHPQGKEVFSLKELTDTFDSSKMHLQGPIVDIDKLTWFNQQWFKRLSQKDIYSRLNSFKPKPMTQSDFQKLWPLINERIETLDQLPDLLNYFFTQPKIDLKSLKKEAKMSDQEIINYLDQVKSTLKSTTPWTVKAIETNLHQLQKKLQLKPRPAFMTVRIALTGRSATPPLFDVIQFFTKQDAIKRLDHAKEEIKKN